MLRRFSVDQAVSEKFVTLMEAYTLSHNLSLPDALIAATAIVYELDLFTLNQKDFRYIPELTLYEP